MSRRGVSSGRSTCQGPDGLTGGDEGRQRLGPGAEADDQLTCVADHASRQTDQMEPGQKNLWAMSGSGSLPSAWYKAISVTWKVRKPYDFRMVNLALLFRPSTTPLESCFLARK